MKFAEVNFAEATAAQLRAAAAMFGVDTNPTDTRVALQSRIRTVFQGDTLRLPVIAEAGDMSGTPPQRPVDEEDAEIAASSMPVKASETRFPNAKQDPVVRLIINNVERDGVTTSTPLTLGNNGEYVTVDRGHEVDLPYRFFDSLKRAEKLSYDQVEGEEDMRETRTPMHPYSVVSMPPAAEIAAWEKRMASISIGQ